MLTYNAQAVNLAILQNKKVSLVLISVYVSLTTSIRDEFWLYLEQLLQVVRCPWVVKGDFNQLVLPEEKKGGSQRYKDKANRLGVLIDWCELVDMGFHGP